jgi:hypothetical protein
MNEIESGWKSYTAKAREQWRKLNDEQLLATHGEVMNRQQERKWTRASVALVAGATATMAALTAKLLGLRPIPIAPEKKL